MSRYTVTAALCLIALMLLVWLLIGPTGDSALAAPSVATVVVPGDMTTATPPPSIVCPATREDVSGLCHHVYLPSVGK